MAECLHDLLQCSICLERFTHPKMLSCQHTFCLNCLRGIAKDEKTLACPQCRVEHQLPKGGVDGLVDNMTIKSLLNMVQEETGSLSTTIAEAACFDCGRKGSLSACEHCKESVCADCRVSHARIFAEIAVYLKLNFYDSDSKEQETRADKESDQNDWSATFSEKILEEEAAISEKFNELQAKIAEKIEEQKAHLRMFLDILKTRVCIEFNKEKSRLMEKIKDELSACKTTLALEEFKNLLQTTERCVAAYLQDTETDIQIEIDYDEHDFQKRLVTLRVGDSEEAVVRGFGSKSYVTKDYSSCSSVLHSKASETGRTSKETLPTQVDYKAKDGTVKSIIKRHPELPTQVDYKAKDGTVKSIIERHPETKTLVPDFAVYSQHSSSVFCTSGGQVLVYPLVGCRGGQILSLFITDCGHIAATDSGKVLVAKESAVNIFDLVNRESIRHQMETISVTPKLEVKVDTVTSIDQICCYGEQFALLGRKEENILIFAEDGRFIRQFHVDNVAGSRMTVDQHGQIYLTVMPTIKEKREIGQMKGCPNHKHLRKPSQLLVTLNVNINVYTWAGQFLGNIEAPSAVKSKYEYTFDATCGPCTTNWNHIRNESSVPDDARITKEHCIRGLCVDGNGCLSLVLKNQILVYSQKPQLAAPHDSTKPEMDTDGETKNTQLKLVTTVGDNITTKGGFAGELGGISLMPDGRMIVCEKGSNRIVIL